MRTSLKLAAGALVLTLASCGKSLPPSRPGLDRHVAHPGARTVPSPGPAQVAMVDPVMTPRIAALMRREADENVLCRDGYDADGLRACNRRATILDQLEKSGWCIGPIDKPMSNEDWMKCRDDPGYRPGGHEKPDYTEEEIREFSAEKSKDDAALRSYGNGTGRNERLGK